MDKEELRDLAQEEVHARIREGVKAISEQVREEACGGAWGQTSGSGRAGGGAGAPATTPGTSSPPGAAGAAPDAPGPGGGVRRRGLRALQAPAGRWEGGGVGEVPARGVGAASGRENAGPLPGEGEHGRREPHRPAAPGGASRLVAAAAETDFPWPVPGRHRPHGQHRRAGVGADPPGSGGVDEEGSREVLAVEAAGRERREAPIS